MLPPNNGTNGKGNGYATGRTQHVKSNGKANPVKKRAMVNSIQMVINIQPPAEVFDFGDSEVLDNRDLLKVLSEVRNGNFAVRMPVDKLGISGKICDTLNEIIILNETLFKS